MSDEFPPLPEQAQAEIASATMTPTTNIRKKQQGASNNTQIYDQHFVTLNEFYTSKQGQVFRMPLCQCLYCLQGVQDARDRGEDVEEATKFRRGKSECDRHLQHCPHYSTATGGAPFVSLFPISTTTTTAAQQSTPKRRKTVKKVVKSPSNAKSDWDARIGSIENEWGVATVPGRNRRERVEALERNVLGRVFPEKSFDERLQALE